MDGGAGSHTPGLFLATCRKRRAYRRLDEAWSGRGERETDRQHEPFAGSLLKRVDLDQSEEVHDTRLKQTLAV